jgi:hypothetical protein
LRRSHSQAQLRSLSKRRRHDLSGRNPILVAIAERLRDRTAPLAPDDDAHGYAHAYLCGSLGAIFAEVAEVFDPEGDTPPLAPLLDPTLCPAWALPWLAQMVGIVLPDGLSEA